MDKKLDKLTNKDLVNIFNASADGHLSEFSKTASASGMLRRKLHEDSFCQAVIPLDDYSDGGPETFMTLEDSEEPVVMFEMEPDQFAPTQTSWSDTGEQREFTANKFTMSFTRLTTPVYMKNIEYLRTWRAPITELIEDNCIRDLNRLKDNIFINGCEDIVGPQYGVSPYTGLAQNITYGDRMTKTSHAAAMNLLPSVSLPIGIHLINRTTATEILRWDETVIGRGKDSFTERLTLEGLNAFGDTGNKYRLHGYDHLVTMKSDIIANGVMWSFTQTDFLGKGGTLQPMKLFVDKKEDIIQWKATEKIGFVIANTVGVFKINYLGSTGPNGNDGRLTEEPTGD